MGTAMGGNLGLGPEVWLLLALLSCLTVFFKFSRIFSIRNLDLLLLFALAPGMLALVGSGQAPPWGAFVWLFLGSALWLARCLIDLGLVRRPLLEPNLNAAGLACLATGVLGLLMAETVWLPLNAGAARNPADPQAPGDLASNAPGIATNAAVDGREVPDAPRPGVVRWRSTQVIVSRILAVLGHLGLVAGMIVIGWRHFGRPILGLATATCYLLLPYTRIEVVDSGQVVPAALVVAALAVYTRPALAGLLIGLAGAWMPACLGLLGAWAGFYRGRGSSRFLGASGLVVAIGSTLGFAWPVGASWCRALGARSLAEAGLLPFVEPTGTGSFWSGIDPAYRLPVLVAYAALAIAVAFWPSEKDFGQLIALSAALLVAAQFWYLARGGTLVLLYLPLVLLMMFRPNLATKRPPLRPSRRERASATLSAIAP